MLSSLAFSFLILSLSSSLFFSFTLSLPSLPLSHTNFLHIVSPLFLLYICLFLLLSISFCCFFISRLLCLSLTFTLSFCIWHCVFTFCLRNISLLLASFFESSLLSSVSFSFSLLQARHLIESIYSLSFSLSHPLFHSYSFSLSVPSFHSCPISRSHSLSNFLFILTQKSRSSSFSTFSFFQFAHQQNLWKKFFGFPILWKQINHVFFRGHSMAWSASVLLGTWARSIDCWDCL